MECSPQIFLRRIPEANRTDLVIKHDGAWVTNMTLEQKSDGDMAPVAMSLSDLEAQALMDRLWSAGLRPSEGSGSAGALAATERHLADMRELVFPPETKIGPCRNNWGVIPC